jgi:hypothetical protein
VTRRANELLKAQVMSPKGGSISVIVSEGLSVQMACRTVEVSESGYYNLKVRVPSEREIRHAWLTDLITQVHAESRGTLLVLNPQ